MPQSSIAPKQEKLASSACDKNAIVRISQTGGGIVHIALQRPAGITPYALDPATFGFLCHHIFSLDRNSLKLCQTDDPVLASILGTWHRTK